MKVSLNWLGEMVQLPRGVQPLVDLLTLAGIEVESIDERGRDIPNVVAAEIVESVPHPNADRLSVCSVNDGTETRRQIVCGAKNYRVGDKVPLALPGAVLPDDFKIKVGKLRGVESQGMLCSPKELNLAEDADGLLILSPDVVPGTPFGEIFPSDTVLDLEITPNRPDLLSYAGIAREIGALLNLPVRFPALRTTETVAAANDVEITVEGCPFYSVRRIEAVKIGPSPDWLDRKLRAAGLSPINNVVDVTNYVMLELGQPLHAFDAARVSGAIRVRSAERDERIAALDGKTYQLAPGDVVIADASAARAIGGIMGGKDSAVSTETTTIWLEAAEFQPQRIRRTSRRLGLSSDSSYRFERGIDRQSVMVASQRATELITEVAGGRALAPIRLGETPAASEQAKERSVSLRPPVSAHDPKEKLTLSEERESAGSPIPLRPERVKALLGIEVPEQQIRDILIRFGLKADGENWRAPSFRADLSREVDLIEEIARVIGMDAIPSRMQARYAPSSQADGCYDRLLEIRRACVAQGLIEARSLVLIPEMPLGSRYTGWGESQTLRVKNPMIEDQVLLRPHLLHGLLRAVQTNAHAGERSVRLFEIGRVYSQAAPEESTHLAIVLSGPIEERSWRESSAPDAEMSLLKGILEAVFAGTVSLERQNNPELALAIRIAINNAPLGFAGQLTESAARALDANAPVLFAEIALDDLVRKALSPRRARELPRFPAVSRDIALLVPLEVTHAQIVAVLERAQEPLLVQIALFDLFTDETGEKLPRDKKSLAYSLTYRAPERTLTAIEVNAAHARLKERLKSELSVVLRE